jgi:hypothetical protein
MAQMMKDMSMLQGKGDEFAAVDRAVEEARQEFIKMGSLAGAVQALIEKLQKIAGAGKPLGGLVPDSSSPIDEEEL